MTWRIVFSHYDRTERVVDVPDVAALRAALDRARSDPHVIAWRYWRLIELAGEVRTDCRSCGEQYQPGRVRDRQCLCGVIHVEHTCGTCHVTFIDPPYEEGCGPIPVDTEGINARYRRKRRRWTP
jgi:hypothetical protein